MWSTLNIASFGGAIRPGYVIPIFWQCWRLPEFPPLPRRHFSCSVAVVVNSFPCYGEFRDDVLNMVVAVRYTNTQEVLEASEVCQYWDVLWVFCHLGSGFALSAVNES